MKDKIIKSHPKYKLFPNLRDLFLVEERKEIILTTKEAKKYGIDLKKNPKGYYIKIDGIRVPINIKD